MKLSILIKTYNEEEKIQKCLDAVFLAIGNVFGSVEVIVADSLSTDATVDLASAYPVKIVQLCMPVDRGCGTGAQLGFQHSKGEFIYLLDGDMELQHDFLIQALELIEKDVSIGGVAGLLQDSQMSNWFDRRRDKSKPSAIAGELDWLAGGGLYRRAALLDSGGYAGNRNMKAYEEAELGLRLRSRGWRMLRLPIVGVIHTGHTESTLSNILRQWRSGRVNSGGVLLKSALGKPWFLRVLRMFIHPLLVIGYWTVLFILLMLGHVAMLVVVSAGLGMLSFAALVVKKSSVVDACFSVLLWHLSAIGLFKGAMSRLQSPLSNISSIVLKDVRAGKSGV
jgi:GT2 family glycosyltransferase